MGEITKQQNFNGLNGSQRVESYTASLQSKSLLSYGEQKNKKNAHTQNTGGGM